jgi:hypothetical protein
MASRDLASSADRGIFSDMEVAQPLGSRHREARMEQDIGATFILAAQATREQMDGDRGITPREVASNKFRTDNAIKNYFYSTIRRSLRRIGKFVGSKNSTEQMKKIKPSTLSKIFAAGTELAP